MPPPSTAFVSPRPSAKTRRDAKNTRFPKQNPVQKRKRPSLAHNPNAQSVETTSAFLSHPSLEASSSTCTAKLAEVLQRSGSTEASMKGSPLCTRVSGAEDNHRAERRAGRSPAPQQTGTGWTKSVAQLLIGDLLVQLHRGRPEDTATLQPSHTTVCAGHEQRMALMELSRELFFSAPLEPPPPLSSVAPLSPQESSLFSYTEWNTSLSDVPLLILPRRMSMAIPATAALREEVEGDSSGEVVWRCTARSLPPTASALCASKGSLSAGGSVKGWYWGGVCLSSLRLTDPTALHTRSSTPHGVSTAHDGAGGGEWLAAPVTVEVRPLLPWLLALCRHAYTSEKRQEFARLRRGRSFSTHTTTGGGAASIRVTDTATRNTETSDRAAFLSGVSWLHHPLARLWALWIAPLEGDQCFTPSHNGHTSSQTFSAPVEQNTHFVAPEDLRHINEEDTPKAESEPPAGRPAPKLWRPAMFCDVSSVRPCSPWYFLDPETGGCGLLEGVVLLRGRPRVIVEAVSCFLPSPLRPSLATHRRNDSTRSSDSAASHDVDERAYLQRVQQHWESLLPYIPVSHWGFIAALACGDPLHQQQQRGAPTAQRDVALSAAACAEDTEEDDRARVWHVLEASLPFPFPSSPSPGSLRGGGTPASSPPPPPPHDTVTRKYTAAATLWCALRFPDGGIPTVLPSTGAASEAVAPPYFVVPFFLLCRLFRVRCGSFRSHSPSDGLVRGSAALSHARRGGEGEFPEGAPSFRVPPLQSDAVAERLCASSAAVRQALETQYHCQLFSYSEEVM